MIGRVRCVIWEMGVQTSVFLYINIMRVLDWGSDDICVYTFINLLGMDKNI